MKWIQIVEGGIYSASQHRIFKAAKQYKKRKGYHFKC